VRRTSADPRAPTWLEMPQMPTQITDVSLDPYGITYTGDGETWKVAEGVRVFGAEIGAYSEHSGSTLNNKGAIYGGWAGVRFDAMGGVGNYVVKNKGKIQGAETAVGVIGFTGSVLIENQGKLKGGYLGALVESGAGDVLVRNEGTITAAFYALVVASVADASGPVIENSGKVEAGALGILVTEISDEGSGLFTTIRNHDTGLITSFSAAIVAQSALLLENDGRIKGTVITDSFDDTIINRGKIKGGVWLGEGADVFKNKGIAKAGMIDTAAGNDLVVLGDKSDRLLFNSDLDALTNVDTIRNFESGVDRIYLNIEIFSEIPVGPLAASQFHRGTAAVDADDRIIYDKATGKLYYDADGSGPGEQVQFADLGAETRLKASDFRVGNYEVNVLLLF
jgi:Ca2+-binding RTX toxin-like protein